MSESFKGPAGLINGVGEAAWEFLSGQDCTVSFYNDPGVGPSVRLECIVDGKICGEVDLLYDSLGESLEALTHGMRKRLEEQG